jgi:hypothetical protein
LDAVKPWSISMHKIPKLYKHPFLEKLNPQNITAGFEKAEIWTLNLNVITAANFLPAEVTNPPKPAAQNAPDISMMDDPHSGSVFASSPILMDCQQSTPNLPITLIPESIRPYPKAKNAKAGLAKTIGKAKVEF